MNSSDQFLKVKNELAQAYCGDSLTEVSERCIEVRVPVRMGNVQMKVRVEHRPKDNKWDVRMWRPQTEWGEQSMLNIKHASVCIAVNHISMSQLRSHTQAKFDGCHSAVSNCWLQIGTHHREGFTKRNPPGKMTKAQLGKIVKKLHKLWPSVVIGATIASDKQLTALMG